MRIQVSVSDELASAQSPGREGCFFFFDIFFKIVGGISSPPASSAGEWVDVIIAVLEGAIAVAVLVFVAIGDGRMDGSRHFTHDGRRDVGELRSMLLGGRVGWELAGGRRRHGDWWSRRTLSHGFDVAFASPPPGALARAVAGIALLGAIEEFEELLFLLLGLGAFVALAHATLHLLGARLAAAAAHDRRRRGGGIGAHELVHLLEGLEQAFLEGVVGLLELPDILLEVVILLLEELVAIGQSLGHGDADLEVLVLSAEVRHGRIEEVSLALVVFLLISQAFDLDVKRRYGLATVAIHIRIPGVIVAQGPNTRVVPVVARPTLGVVEPDGPRSHCSD